MRINTRVQIGENAVYHLEMSCNTVLQQNGNGAFSYWVFPNGESAFQAMGKLIGHGSVKGNTVTESVWSAIASKFQGILI